MTDFAAARRHMVDGQVRPADVTDLRIISAMQAVARERFVPPEAAGLAYLDRSLSIGGTRCLLKPVVLAKLIQALELEPTDRVLVVGCATGYAAAVLGQIAGQVVALEQDDALVQAARAALASQPNVIVAKGPLVEGWERGGAFDAILVDGAIEVLPDAFRRQLKEGGRLACVLGGAPQASARLYRRSGDELGGRAIFDAAAAPLPGFAKTPVFAF
ncbi:MAG: protein-L-isoaspartate O-methyltransferase [Hyphomicrobiales bacterium]|nr:protein-L-isoaspartate O-methyltransferase [Hyphomicrobiales bacterium]